MAPKSAYYGSEEMKRDRAQDALLDRQEADRRRLDRSREVSGWGSDGLTPSELEQERFYREEIERRRFIERSQRQLELDRQMTTSQMIMNGPVWIGFLDPTLNPPPKPKKPKAAQPTTEQQIADQKPYGGREIIFD